MASIVTIVSQAQYQRFQVEVDWVYPGKSKYVFTDGRVIKRDQIVSYCSQSCPSLPASTIIRDDSYRLEVYTFPTELPS